MSSRPAGLFRPTFPAAFLAAVAVFPLAACDDQAAAPLPTSHAEDSASPSPPPPAPPEPARAPDILVDSSNVSVGTDRVPSRELGLADKVAVLAKDRPGIAGRAVDFVAMRNAKPSQVVAVVAALQRAGATGAGVKTEARDGTTQRIALSFATSVADCATVAWIAKDAAIDVWPAGGGRARRIVKGLAGPDMTLGSEAVHARAGSCRATELVTGADDALTWGLVFDLAATSLHAPGSPADAALLVTHAIPGRKLILP